MLKKVLTTACALSLAAIAAACGGNTTTTTNANLSNTNATANANAGAANMTAGARTAPDNSEITTTTEGGVTTETRTFRDPNSRVSKVVVTTRDGRRTARVHYRDNTVRELPEGDVERALDATGDALVSAGGTVVDVSKDVGSEIGDKAEDVGGAAADGAKKVGSEVGDKAEDVGDKAVSGAKKAGKATVKGAKKVGGAVKDAVTP